LNQRHLVGFGSKVHVSLTGDRDASIEKRPRGKGIEGKEEAEEKDEIVDEDVQRTRLTRKKGWEAGIRKKMKMKTATEDSGRKRKSKKREWEG
jgi:hypothetical protein